MKMKIDRILAVAVVAAMVFSASPLLAGEGWGDTAMGGKRADHFEKMTKELDLNPQQKEAMARHRESFMPKMEALRDKTHKAREALKAELDKTAPDKTRLDAIVAELKTLAGEKVQMMVDKVIAMKSILTPEQFAKMQKIMEEKKARFKSRHGEVHDKDIPKPPPEEM